MPSEDTEIIELNQYWKSDKTPFIIYEGFESLIEKIDGCENNPEKSFYNRVKGTYSIRFLNDYNIII